MRPRRPGITKPVRCCRAQPRTFDSGEQVEDRLEVVLAADVRAAMKRFGPRELDLAYTRLPDLRRPPPGFVLVMVRVLPALPGGEMGRG